MAATRTPEGEPNECPVCGDRICIEPSPVPDRDAPCPRCGCLLHFEDPQHATARLPFSAISPFLAKIIALAGSPDRKRLVVDLGREEMMTSEGLGRLIAAHRRAAAAGMVLVLSNVHPAVRDVFRITKLDQVIEIADR